VADVAAAGEAAVSWRWEPEAEQLALDAPPRQLTIRWDDGDRGWFLSVIYPPRPATMGQPATEARVYVCPLPLLCALVLVPPSLHEHLTWRVRREMEQSRGAVIGLMQEAVSELPLPWPGQAKARDALEAAAEFMPVVERLALDWAAAGAMED
jgi:hypothetical protein